MKILDDIENNKKMKILHDTEYNIKRTIKLLDKTENKTK